MIDAIVAPAGWSSEDMYHVVSSTRRDTRQILLIKSKPNVKKAIAFELFSN